MRPGPSAPYRGMGANMMMGPRIPRSGPGPFAGPPTRSFGPAQPQMNPLFGATRQSTRQGQGGLLANLFGKGSGGAGLQNLRGGSASASGGGLLRSLTNPGSINGFLNNTQQVLKTAQQVGPMIQQYGPMVKNLPAMWKLYRSFKDLPDQEEKPTEETPKNEKVTSAKKSVLTTGKKSTKSAATTSQSPQASAKVKKIKKESTPKLFF